MLMHMWANEHCLILLVRVRINAVPLAGQWVALINISGDTRRSVFDSAIPLPGISYRLVHTCTQRWISKNICFSIVYSDMRLETL